MPIEIRDGSTWKDVDADKFWVRDGGSWKAVKAAWVRDASSWKQVFQQSDPQTVTVDLINGSQVYRGVSGVTSTRNGNANFLHYGFQFNSEIERSMAFMTTTERNTLRDAVIARPVISKIEVFLWTQHTQNSAPADMYVGWHSNSSKPSNFARLHTEKQSGWTSGLLSMPHNSSGGGNQTSFVMPTNIHTNLSNTIQAGNLWGLTLSDEDANSSSQWGWTAGDDYCTSESGGTCNGSTVNCGSSDPERVRIAVTSDFV